MPRVVNPLLRKVGNAGSLLNGANGRSIFYPLDADASRLFGGAPAITSFDKTHVGTGTLVTITGMGFTGATAVKFGGVNASSFNVVNATTITATVAATTSGMVSVTTPGGTATSGSTFTFDRLYDTFTDTNGTALASHTMDVGAGWTVPKGSFTVQSNQAQSATAAADNEAVADAGTAAHTISTVAFSPSSTIRLGLICRYGASDAASFVGYFDTNLGQIQILENFVTTRATGALTYVAGKSWNMTLQASGNTVTFTVTQADNPANTQSISYGSASAGNTNTKVAIHVFGTGGKHDAFEVTSP